MVIALSSGNWCAVIVAGLVALDDHSHTAIASGICDVAFDVKSLRTCSICQASAIHWRVHARNHVLAGTMGEILTVDRDAFESDVLTQPAMRTVSNGRALRIERINPPTWSSGARSRPTGEASFGADG